MTENFWNHVSHAVAGAIIVAVPLAIAQIPESWQALTVGGVLALLLSVAKTYYNAS